MFRVEKESYLVSWRLLRGGFVATIVIFVAIFAGISATSARWLPAIGHALEADAAIDQPDVVVLRADGQDTAVEQRAAALWATGRIRAVALFGEPFTSDTSISPGPSPRVKTLAALGIPTDRILAMYDGEDLYDQMVDLRDGLRRANLRRALFLSTEPGTRRNLIIAQRVLGAGGIEVGQVSIPSPRYDPDTWWLDGQSRSRVMLNLTSLLITVAVSRG